ncbi:uncharacterized protein EI90DRAFT_2509358 [Cantharellus anzutake]|uniref:uncharacterized protein n=1 Tax=Cantharellus anzutake TaxID=1750568 RepID=UPI001907511F|nr:uncharacterized protein EI90DRAFT_2509358 [Cantharellus anzutake]KAF8321409.1 hypothetical protein EI90DRAFT_2509358 [Cantharellus anzutake]
MAFVAVGFLASITVAMIHILASGKKNCAIRWIRKSAPCKHGILRLRLIPPWPTPILVISWLELYCCYPTPRLPIPEATWHLDRI